MAARSVYSELASFEGLNIGQALSVMTRAFSDAGVESAHSDARFLIQGVLQIDGTMLITRSDRVLGASAPLLADVMRRRLACEPVSRILGRRAFYGRDFILTPDVLDPRPDTESVVDLALDLVRQRGMADEPLRLADIGTGSGILIATMLAELPRASGIATDISAGALRVARENAVALGVRDRAEFFHTRGLSGCHGPLDLVVSNPPYVATADIPVLAAEVRKYDPLPALDGGPDGLAVYREIGEHIAELQLSTLLVLEVGAGQAKQVEQIFEAFGARPARRRKDLGGHDRAVALEIHQ